MLPPSFCGISDSFLSWKLLLRFSRGHPASLLLTLCLGRVCLGFRRDFGHEEQLKFCRFACWWSDWLKEVRKCKKYLHLALSPIALLLLVPCTTSNRDAPSDPEPRPTLLTAAAKLFSNCFYLEVVPRDLDRSAWFCHIWWPRALLEFP